MYMVALCFSLCLANEEIFREDSTYFPPNRRRCSLKIDNSNDMCKNKNTSSSYLKCSSISHRRYSSPPMLPDIDENGDTQALKCNNLAPNIRLPATSWRHEGETSELTEIKEPLLADQETNTLYGRIRGVPKLDLHSSNPLTDNHWIMENDSFFLSYLLLTVQGYTQL